MTSAERAVAISGSPRGSGRMNAGVKGERLPDHYRPSELPVPLWLNEMGSY